MTPSTWKRGWRMILYGLIEIRCPFFGAKFYNLDITLFVEYRVKSNQNKQT